MLGVPLGVCDSESDSSLNCRALSVSVFQVGEYTGLTHSGHMRSQPGRQHFI